MVISAVIFALVGNLLINSANSAAINYEPIKITVNENFNGQPSHVSTELQSVEPGVLHQGANFYYKPQLNLPPSYPSRIEALMSLIQQHHHSCAKDASKVVVEKDKLVDILKPFMYPWYDNSKETLLKSEIISPRLVDISTKPRSVPILITEEPMPASSDFQVIPKAAVLPRLPINDIQAVPSLVDIEPKSATSKFLVIPEAPLLPPRPLGGMPSFAEKKVKKEEAVILEQPTGMLSIIPEISMRPVTEPIINYVEPKLMTSELLDIPEAPVLSPLSFDRIPSVVKEDLKKEESIILEEPAVKPTTELIINNVEPKPITSGLQAIPEAPVLPPLSFDGIPPAVKEELKKEESVILDEPQEILSTIPEIAVKPMMEPIINYVEPKPLTSELPVIPEAPLLPPLPLGGIPPFVEEEVKKEEAVILEQPTGTLSIIPEISMRPVTEPIINYVEPKLMTSELLDIPEAPVLSPLSFDRIPSVVKEDLKKEESIILEEPAVKPTTELIIDNVEPKPITSGLQAIPEAPLLPPLPLGGIPPFVEEEVKKGEAVILEQPTGTLSIIPEISMRPVTEPIINYVEPKLMTSELLDIPEAPVLSPLSFDRIPSVVKEDLKKEESIILEEPAVKPTTELIIDNVEPKPITSGLQAIPEAPLLPPLPLGGIPPFVEEEVKKEEAVILEQPTGTLSIIPEISMRPVTEPIINYVEPKLMTSELLDIPEAPVLSPLSFDRIPSVVKEDLKKEESIILEEPAVKPTTELIINNVEPKPITSGLQAIPEAPVLPPLSFDGIPPAVKEELKKEESVILEEPQEILSTTPEIAVKPMMEPIINYVESKPLTSELPVIPEAPLLPPLPLGGIPPFVEEEVKKEEAVILEQPTGTLSIIPEISMRPVTEPIINYVEPKLMTSELLDIPEAPVLSPLSFDRIPSVVKEDLKKEESIKLQEPAVKPTMEPIINNVEPKPITSGLQAIPEAPVVPPLSFDGIPPAVKEELKKEEWVIFEKPNKILSTIPEIAMKPMMEPIINYVESKPLTSELPVIPEAPLLPPLPLGGIPSFVEEEVKKEEAVILEQPTGTLSMIPEISMRPVTEPIINHVEPKLMTAELLDIPEAPVLSPLTFNSIPSVVKEDVKKEESVVLEEPKEILSTIPEIAIKPMMEPIINYVEPKPLTSKLLVIPEAPVLLPLSLDGSVLPIVEDEFKKDESIILEEPTGILSTIPEIAMKPTTDPVINYFEPKPITSELQAIPEAPVLPPLSFDGIPPAVEEELKKEESVILEEPKEILSTIPEIAVKPMMEPIINYVETNPLTSELPVIPEAPVLLPLSLDGIPPFVEEVKKEEAVILESPNAMLSTIPEISLKPMMEPIINYVEPKPTVDAILPPRFIPKPKTNLGVFSYVPSISHLSNRAPKSKTLMIPKPASLERFLLKKHQLRSPVTPFPKLALDAMKSPILENKNHFIYPTSYAHDVIEKRIAPNMAFKKNGPPKRVKIYIRSNVPKGSSY